MSVIQVAILGFGTVGEGVYKTIQSHQQELSTILGKKVEVAAVLIRNKNKVRNIGEGILVTTDFDEILRLPQLDVVMEAIVEQEPSFTYLKKAIAKGCHIITANKEMFAHHGRELLEIAAKHDVSVGFEATVAGGIPIIQTLRQLFHVNQIQKIQGILNGTSNFILTEMREKKQSFTDALKQAQLNGFAEADPTNDVEGIDTFYKLMILSKMAFGQEPKWNEVELNGITKITSEWINLASNLGLRFKHLAAVSQNGGQVTASVKPILVAKNHPFYSIEGVQNAVNIVADIVGSITLQGPGAGMFPTASAMLEDLIYVLKNKAETIREPKRQTVDAASSIEPESFWIVGGVYKKRMKHSIHWVKELKGGCYLLKTTADGIAVLAEQNKEFISFQIYGDMETLN